MAQAPLFEFQLHPPKIENPKRRGEMIPSGPPLIFRFYQSDTVEVGIGERFHVFKAARHAELFDRLADHIRGPTTSQPDQVLLTLTRIASANPENETVFNYERGSSPVWPR